MWTHAILHYHRARTMTDTAQHSSPSLGSKGPGCESRRKKLNPCWCCCAPQSLRKIMDTACTWTRVTTRHTCTRAPVSTASTAWLPHPQALFAARLIPMRPPGCHSPRCLARCACAARTSCVCAYVRMWVRACACVAGGLGARRAEGSGEMLVKLKCKGGRTQYKKESRLLLCSIQRKWMSASGWVGAQRVWRGQRGSCVGLWRGRGAW